MRRLRADDGFTLVELMVVVLIIGVLLAIAVPGFLTAQERAKKIAATSNVRSALSAVKIVYSDLGTYESVAPGGPVTQAVLLAANPSPGWGASGGAAPSPSVGPEHVSWQGVGDVMLLASRAADGTCYYLRDDVTAGGGVSYGADKTSPCVANGFAGTWRSSPSAAGW